jgi:hypothetical protein
MSTFLYLDIETLPTENEEVIADLTAAISPPASIKKAETLELWEKETKPCLIEEAVAKTSFNGAWGSVCCIGWAYDNGDAKALYRKNGEKEFLTKVFAEIDTASPRYSMTTIVGHHVGGFDVRFLWQRCFVLGIRAPSWLPLDPKPWSNTINDTMQMFCGANSKISLDNLCKAMGLPGKGDMTGADVAAAWARGEYQKIADYCREDVERVRAVHRQMLIATGMETPNASGSDAY